MDVSADIDGRGYHDYEDDGCVYDITVDGNHNFLTQRLAEQHFVPQRGKRKGQLCTRMRAVPVFVGNCFNQLDLGDYTSLEAMRGKVMYAIKEGSQGFGFR